MIKPTQFDRILLREKQLENDLSMLSWKVYSTSSILDDIYLDDLSDSNGIDLIKSFGHYVSPSGGNGGYFEYLEATTGTSEFKFPLVTDVVRKPLQSTIEYWISDQMQGSMFQSPAIFSRWSSGRVTIRNKLNALNFTHNADTIRVQISASSNEVILDHMSVGQWLPGTSVGMTSNPTVITFNNGDPGIVIPPNSSVWSDWISFTINYGTDYVFVADLADGSIQYSSTNNLGFSIYRESATSYNLAAPNESLYAAGSPDFNTYVIITSIQYMNHKNSGHFISSNVPVSIGVGETSEIETGCLIDFGNSTGTIIAIIEDGAGVGHIVLDEYADTSPVVGIYGTKYDTGVISINSSLNNTPTQYELVKGTPGISINARDPRYWDEVTGISVTQTTPGESLIYHFVSFDFGITWKVFKNSEWRPVARLEFGSLWQYNNSETNVPNWINSIYNDGMSALKLSLTSELNCMTRDELIVVTPAEWVSVGGFLPWVYSDEYIYDTTTRIEFSFAMKSDGINIPTFTKYDVGYSIDMTDINLVTQAWEASEINPVSASCMLLVISAIPVVPNVDIKVYISTDNGIYYDQITNLVTISTVGTRFYLRGDLTDLPQRNSKTIRMKVVTLNHLDIKIDAISLGLKY